MQNSTLNRVEENEISRFSQLLKRIQIAWKLIVNPKAIVIINSKIDAFQTSPDEIEVVCDIISSEIHHRRVEDEIITRSINKLVYN